VIRALLVLVIFASVAHAQAPRAPAPRAPQAQAQDKREQVKKKIRAMRAFTLTDELSLDEKAASKLFPILSKWDDVTDKLLQQRVDIQRRLTNGTTTDPKQIDKIIDEAVANQKAFWDLEEKRLAEMRKVLTPEQTARLLVVLPAFERKIQNQLKRAIAKRGQQRGGSDIDEDDLDPDEEPARGGTRRR
jgi:Spy/CpxP family protein refolding chaperone